MVPLEYEFWAMNYCQIHHEIVKFLVMASPSCQAATGRSGPLTIKNWWVHTLGEYTKTKHACAHARMFRYCIAVYTRMYACTRYTVLILSTIGVCTHTLVVLKMSTVYLVLMIPPLFLYTTDDRRIYQTIINTQTKLVLIFLKY